MRHDEPFMPEYIDEQIDQFSSLKPQDLAPPNAQIVQRLHTYYEANRHSAARIWERLGQRVSEHDSRAFPQERENELREERTQPMPQITFPSRRAKRGWLATSAAALFAILLVISLLWVLHIASFTQTATPKSPFGIYVNTQNGISRFDIQTHQVIWHTSIPGRGMLDFSQAPVVINDMVYIYYGGHLLAFHAETGAALWSRSFTGDIATAPYLVDGLLVVLTESPDNSTHIDEIDPASGAIEVTYQRPQVGWQSVAVNNHVLYYVDRITLYAVQLPGKEPLWQRQVIQNPAQNSLQVLGQVSVAHGVVYITTRSLENAPHYLFALDARTGKKIWQSPAIHAGFQQLAITSDTIYASTQQGHNSTSEGNLYAFDAHTYKLIWLRHMANSNFFVDTGTLYFIQPTTIIGGNGENRIVLGALNSSNGQTIWEKAYVFPGMTILGVQSGVLYVAGWDIHNNVSKSVLYALKPGDGSVLWQMPVGDWSITIV